MLMKKSCYEHIRKQGDLLTTLPAWWENGNPRPRLRAAQHTECRVGVARRGGPVLVLKLKLNIFSHL